MAGPYDPISDESKQRHFDMWGCGHSGCSLSLGEHLPQTSSEWHLLSSQRGRELVDLRRQQAKNRTNSQEK